MDCMFGTPKKLEGSTITLRTASNSTGKSGDVHFHLEVHGNTGVINVGTPVCAPSVGLGTPATVVREGGAGKRNAITANNTSVSANKMALFASDAFPGCQGEIIVRISFAHKLQLIFPSKSTLVPNRAQTPSLISFVAHCTTQANYWKLSLASVVKSPMKFLGTSVCGTATSDFVSFNRILVLHRH